MATLRVALAAALLLAGCAELGVGGGGGGNGGGDNLPAPETAAQAQMREQSERANATMIQGALIGAAAGGVGAAILDQIFDFGGSGGVDAGAIAIGAGLGALAGTAAGSYVAEKQQEFATLEARIDDMIVDARGKNGQLAQLVGTMQIVLDEHKRELASIRGQIAAGTGDQAALQRQLATARTDVQVMQNAVTGAQENLDVLADARAFMAPKAVSATERERIGQLDSELGSYSSRITSMQTIVAELSSELQPPPPG